MSNQKALARLDKTEIKITCQKLYNHLTLLLGRKADDFKAKELELANLLKQPYIDKADLGARCQSILRLLKYIKAARP